MFETNSNFESKITFEIPTSIDLEKLAKLNPNFPLLSGLNATNVIDINSSDFVLNGGDFNRGGGGGYLNSGDFNTNANLFYSQYQNDYDRFISDIWVGIILTLMIGLSIFSICACYLYHKYQQWKLSAYNLRHSNDLENGFGIGNGENDVGIQSIDIESLPSYTIVSGLPTYDDAIEQMRKSKSNFLQPEQQQHGGSDLTMANESNQRPSIIKLFSNHYLKYSNTNKDDEEPQPPTPISHKVPAYNEYLYHTVPSYEEAINADCGNNMNLLNEIIIQQSVKHKIPTYEETLSLVNSNKNSRRLSIIEVPVHSSSNSNNISNNSNNNNKFHISSCSNYSSISFSSLDELLNRSKHNNDNNNSNNNNSFNIDKFNFLKTKNLSINF